MQAKVKDTVSIDGMNMCFETAGQGPDVVLVHAGFVDGRMWDGTFEVLAQQYRVTRFDMRGFGRSDALREPVSRRKDLLRLMDHLGIARAVLIGCSLGGEIVLDLALEQPKRVSALVLVSAVPGGFEMQGEPPADLLGMMAAFEQRDLTSVAEYQMRLWIDGPTRTPEQVDPTVRQRAAEMTRVPLERGTFMMDLQPFQPLEPPAATRLNEVRVPTLVIAGELDDPEISRAAGVLEQGIPGARKLILPGVAHLPSMEQPEAFNQAVEAFLREVTV